LETMMTADTAFTPREMLSLMMDGQASAAQTAAVVQACQDDAELMQAWASYHAVGDALRSPWRDARLSASQRDARPLDLAAQDHMPVGSTADMQQTTMTMAHSQPAVAVSSTVSMAATATPVPRSATVGVSPMVQASLASQPAQAEAANDAVFRWKMVAGVAAFAAVSSLVWSLVGVDPTGPASQVAVATQPPVTAQPATVLASDGNGQVMIRDPRLDEMLAAHKQFGGASALQQPAGFLRSATFQAADR
jgi:sigma-E factor negative regulatory protein RseA